MVKATQKARDEALRASVRKEMAKPRMSKSARDGEIFPIPSAKRAVPSAGWV